MSNGSNSVRNHISAISRFYQTHGLLSPSRSPLFASMISTYMNKTNRDQPEARKRIGISAEIAKRVAEYGLTTEVDNELGCCATVIFAFIFQGRSVSVA